MTVRCELAVAAFLVALGVSVITLAARIEAGVITDPLGPRAFPLALGAVLGLCGILLGAGALAFGVGPGRAELLSDAGADEDPEAGPFSPGRFVAAIVATGTYIAAFEPVGYLLATPPYVLAILLVHGGASPRALLTAPLLITVVLYATFRFGLLIPIPEGALTARLPW